MKEEKECPDLVQKIQNFFLSVEKETSKSEIINKKRIRETCEMNSFWENLFKNAWVYLGVKEWRK